jgi:hypothetical protein
MINPWLMILIVAVGVFIASMFRAQQQQRTRPAVRPPQPRDTLDEASSSTDVPVVLRAPRPPRRTMPPPLPRKVQRVEIIAVPPPAEPVPVATAVPPAPLVSPAKPLSRAALSLRDMFRNPQSLRAAILVREVLDAPLCRRRHGRGAKGP